MTVQNRFWFRYGTAVAAAILVFLLLYLLRHYFADRTFMVIYMPVVVYAAFAGGLGPALLATVLCIGISLFFLGQELVANPANLIDVAFFRGAKSGPRIHWRAAAARIREITLQAGTATVDP